MTVLALPSYGCVTPGKRLPLCGSLVLKMEGLYQTMSEAFYFSGTGWFFNFLTHLDVKFLKMFEVMG